MSNFTEFYCQSGGSNLNAGSTTSNTASVTADGGYGTPTANRFTAATGTPFTGVTVGDWASVYITGTTNNTPFVARITAIADGGASIDLSATSFGGVAPAVSATARTCRVGGAWRGPGDAAGGATHPFPISAPTLTNAAGWAPRINFKNTAPYVLTAGIVQLLDGVTFEGYSSTVGDGGIAQFNAIPYVGGSFALVTFTADNITFRNFDLGYNGTTANATIVSGNGQDLLFENCHFHHSRGPGFSTSNTAGVVLIGCTAHSNNGAALVGQGGFTILGRGIFRRCVAYNNTINDTDGFQISGLFPIFFDRCIAFSNSRSGFNVFAAISTHFTHCDSYFNGSSGITSNATSVSLITIENCNFVRNGDFGISIYFTNIFGYVRNCGFGSGTMANASGQINAMGSKLDQSGFITYPADTTPWVDPSAGDFRINLAQAQGAGIGSVTQLAPGYSSFVGFPDVGSAQHLESGGTEPTSEVPSYSTP